MDDFHQFLVPKHSWWRENPRDLWHLLCPYKPCEWCVYSHQYRQHESTEGAIIWREVTTSVGWNPVNPLRLVEFSHSFWWFAGFGKHQKIVPSSVSNFPPLRQNSGISQIFCQKFPNKKIICHTFVGNNCSWGHPGGCLGGWLVPRNAAKKLAMLGDTVPWRSFGGERWKMLQILCSRAVTSSPLLECSLCNEILPSYRVSEGLFYKPLKRILIDQVKKWNVKALVTFEGCPHEQWFRIFFRGDESPLQNSGRIS